MTIIDIIGYIPVVIFPTATIMQLWHLVKSKSSKGVSPVTWGAFALGNFSLYVYTEKYDEPQSIVSFLCTGALQIYIVFLIFKYKRTECRAQ